MSLPTAYLTSTKRLDNIFTSIKTAQAPEKFSQRFLETLGFKAKGDRLIIYVLKALRLLDDGGKPTDLYYKYLEQTQSNRILAECLREAYADLFAVNVNAQNMSKSEIVNKMKTIAQGQYSDAVLAYMATTFLSLCKLADFSAAPTVTSTDQTKSLPSVPEQDNQAKSHLTTKTVKLGGLVYNIQIVLPETRDTAVYDALFKSLKEHII